MGSCTWGGGGGGGGGQGNKKRERYSQTSLIRAPWD